VASAEEYAKWIVDNQDKQGTPEFDTVAKAYSLAKSQTPEPSMLDRAGRVAGLGARALVRGVTAVPTLMAEGVAAPLRALTGGKYFESPSAVLERTMTRAGLPEPANAVERISTDVAGSMVGMGTQLGALSRMPGEISKMLTQQPARQLVAAGTGGAASSVAREAGAGPVGQFAAGAAGSMVPFAPQVIAKTPTPEAIRTAQTAQSGREAGYVLPPSQSRPNYANRFLEGAVAGTAQTERNASIKNQAVTNRLVKKDLGIPETQPVTSEQLSAIRNSAGKDYQRVAEFGAFKTDQQFADDLSNLAQTQTTLAKEVPELANDKIINLSQSLAKPEFTGRTLVEMTKTLRKRATAAFRAQETEVGQFYRGAADALEDMMERNLQASGKTELLNRFKMARTTIAKAHTVEAALDDATGNVSARNLASQYARGKPLSGETQKAAEFSSAFPKSTRTPEQVGANPGMSVFDGIMMAGGGFGPIAAGHPELSALALLPFTRPATRAGILSGPYQNVMASPNANPLPRSEAGLLGLLPNLYQPR
jgi:hypothetical protein